MTQTVTLESSAEMMASLRGWRSSRVDLYPRYSRPCRSGRARSRSSRHTGGEDQAVQPPRARRRSRYTYEPRKRTCQSSCSRVALLSPPSISRKSRNTPDRSQHAGLLVSISDTRQPNAVLVMMNCTTAASRSPERVPMGPAKRGQAHGGILHCRLDRGHGEPFQMALTSLMPCGPSSRWHACDILVGSAVEAVTADGVVL